MVSNNNNVFELYGQILLWSVVRPSVLTQCMVGGQAILHSHIHRLQMVLLFNNWFQSSLWRLPDSRVTGTRPWGDSVLSRPQINSTGGHESLVSVRESFHREPKIGTQRREGLQVLTSVTAGGITPF